MGKGNQLERLDAYVSNADNALMQANDCLASINELGDKITSTVNSFVDLQRDMHMLDVRFNAYVATLDAELERHKDNLPIVEKQLDALNQRLDKVLDKVLAMDANTEKEINEKMHYMQMLENFTDKLATMMIKLL